MRKIQNAVIKLVSLTPLYGIIEYYKLKTDGVIGDSFHYEFIINSGIALTAIGLVIMMISTLAFIIAGAYSQIILGIGVFLMYMQTLSMIIVRHLSDYKNNT